MSDPTLVVPVHYDAASSLCYVAHRVMGRLGGFLDEIDLDLDWTPIDLSGLMGWRPGAPIQPDRLEDVKQIAAHFEVPMRIPTRWQDSRRAGATSLALRRRDGEADTAREPGFRERLFTAVYEQGGRCDDKALLDGILHDMEITLEPKEVEAAALELELCTRRAAAAHVTGVPTFMLGDFPFGGIQDELTMRSFLTRHAKKQREGKA